MTVTASSSTPAPHTTGRITGEELLEMGGVGPCELVEGRIVPMTPAGGQHGYIESQLSDFLSDFVKKTQRGWVMVGEVGLYVRRDPDTVRGADAVVLSKERAPEGPPVGFLDVAPELVVEIVSPGNTWLEMRQKIEEYFAIGVDYVWIVEPETKSVLIFSSSTSMQKYEVGDVLAGEGLLEGFEMPVEDVFAV